MATPEPPSPTPEPAADSKVKQAREVLLGMGLPLDSIEQAVKKIHEFGGDLNAIASYALSISVPQAECIEEQLSDDMISSDEDAGDESKEKWNQPPSRVQSPQAKSASEETWVDPICKIFQIPPKTESLALTCHKGESSAAAAAAAAAEMPSAMVMVNPMVTGEANCSRQFSLEKTIKKEIGPIAPPSPPAYHQSSQRPEREKFFLDMGFPIALVKSAMQQFQQYGSDTDADDSIILQFLIDNNEGITQRAQPKIDAEAEDSDPDEEMRSSVLRTVAARSLKSAAKSDWDPENEARILSDNAQRVPLCNNTEIPQNGSPKDSMEGLGFSHALIERAVQELGKGVDHDMLLEYLLYLSATQDPEASTSANPSRGGEDNTLEKCTTQYEFPAMAVEKAMRICNTPLWNASQEEIMDLVDFLGAHMEDLIQEDAFGGEINLPDSDDSDSEDESLDWGEDGHFPDVSCWNQEGGGKGAFKVSGKRKTDERGKEVAHNGRLGRTKGAISGGRPKKATPNISKPKATETADWPGINKQRGAIGFGLPGQPIVKHRSLKEDVKGAPFFYFENVAGMPVGEWKRIETHLFGIEAEFVDAMHFSACRRSRGYIHNLPIEGRKKLIKDPPMTIRELMPQTKPFWPDWDKRTKLNCINTVRASEFLAKRLGIKDGTGSQKLQLSIEEQKNYLHWCCKLNLVWTSPNIPSPVEADEIEAMLGFDKDHSRHCFGLTARYKALGNSFSVFTVGYHFSVLKPLYPKGIKVLSLFSGIGGAEVALHKVGIKLNVVVSVEIEEGARRCLQTWWALTNQSGCLDLDFHDVRDLTREVLTKLVDKYRGFDFIVGGSPCNNLTGNNRHTRIGLDGEHSTMFFEFSRIVATVRELTIKLPEHRR